MSELTAGQFADFFQALYGYGPFPWQERLARRVADARGDLAPWPEALALPTSAGKTACIDMAVFALACQADLPPADRTAPRRIFFVVDRRVIVDATFERSRELARQLHQAQGGILEEVAGRLRLLSGNPSTDEPPLACFQLRGGMYRDDAWARSPLQPTVVVTTVDQFASRLLFRGYGTSTGMRPVHAGLAANDALVFLDEAHCANPFRQTVTAVQRYRSWALQSGSVPFQLTLVSATPPPGVSETFTAAAEDYNHPVLGRRIKAAKPTSLVVAGDTRGDDVLQHLSVRIAEEAIKLVNDQRRAIGIVVNRVATARLVHKRLAAAGQDAILLIGRMRALDRDDTVRNLESLKTGSRQMQASPHAEGHPVEPDLGSGLPRFVVATQCLEVGADLDFDGLVTECASLDALRQRFGRLNRGGRDNVETRATIVVRADQTDPKNRTAHDPIYGTALAETWQWLKERDEWGGLDFGYAAMDETLPDDPEELDRLRQRAADAPVMLPAHVDAWVQTSPAPSPDPEISLFLHGPHRGAPEAQVCWRADLQADMNEGRQVDIVSLCPPVSSECIATPIHVLRRWIEGSGINSSADDSDLEGNPAPTEGDPRNDRQVRRKVLCWRGPEESYLIVGQMELRDLRPGDTVVIPAEQCGFEVFGHIPPGPDDGEPVIDLGDRAHLQAKAKALLRIHSRTVAKWPEVPSRTFFEKAARSRASSEDWEELESEIPAALERLASEIDAAPQWQWLKDAAHALAGEYGTRRRPRVTPYPGGDDEETGAGFLIQGSRRVQQYLVSASTPTSEDDSYSATVRVSLEDHLQGVEEWTRSFAAGAGLPDFLTEDLALAARLHDVGKSDPRFQAMLNGGNPWAAQAAGVLLAKSDALPTGRGEVRRARRESGYPVAGRHEFLSVRLIESAPGMLRPAQDPELVLHLVASHHGFCRPFAPVVSDDEPVHVEHATFGHHMSACSATGLERLDSGVPERFWRLVRRYGWWGLAWLEALMRLADHRCSEDEQKPRDKQSGEGA